MEGSGQRLTEPILSKIMRKDAYTNALIAAICFMAMAVLIVGAFVFDEVDIRNAKVWVQK